MSTIKNTQGYFRLINGEKMMMSQTEADAFDAANSASDLPTARQVQKDQIRQAFADAIAAGVPVTIGANTFTMQCDWQDGVKVKASYDLAIQLGKAPTAPAVVRSSDNVDHTVTVADLLTISATQGAQYLALWEKKNGYLAQIDAATTVADMQAVVWQ